MFYTFK